MSVWRWALGLDRRWHAVDIATDHPAGWHRTRCERLVPDRNELAREAHGQPCDECINVRRSK